uniref:(northern house mosquito) hypothetical protein n=1 Tax=Culex pipiens TaxID=7175 RepID=A0A8D8ESA8_CULPI
MTGISAIFTVAGFGSSGMTCSAPSTMVSSACSTTAVDPESTLSVIPSSDLIVSSASVMITSGSGISAFTSSFCLLMFNCCSVLSSPNWLELASGGSSSKLPSQHP